jgi:hypothetical protein
MRPADPVSRIKWSQAPACYTSPFAVPFLERKGPLSWEPPIGIEPMTYALREGLKPSSAVHRVTPVLLIGAAHSARVHDRPGLLLADALARSGLCRSSDGEAQRRRA